MREILPLIEHPSHYCGLEEGVVQKDLSKLTLHAALAFPDLYDVGMSYLGQKILLEEINSHPSWLCERVMAPEKKTGDLLKEKNLSLTTLETDTPLKKLHILGFSITHELSYTNVLYMLDLGKIPLYAKERLESTEPMPLVIAGGGALMGAEPLAPFMDLMVLGDGEEIVPYIFSLFEKAQKEHLSRARFLERIKDLCGIYVPSIHTLATVSPKGSNPPPTRTIVADLNKTRYPTRQIVPIGAVHNRLSVEIARGCTRGCRFCQAGMVYRPVRERSVACVSGLIEECLQKTGFEEISFMALSSGDYSALKSLSHTVLDFCQKKQVAVALPSQRVGSIDDEIIAKISDVRRTGMTLAPEAGSQRLRDVINKGITEEDILLHCQKILEHGWRQVKLYFMLGLPTETDEDLKAIVDLCCKVRDCAGKGNPRLQVSMALSPFVPKPFTPFQWEEQVPLEEMERRIALIRDYSRGKKGLSMRWHDPKVSMLEGILARAGREMAEVIERAYQAGAIFCNWIEHFTLEPWLRALEACNFSASTYLRARDTSEELPWDLLEVGIAKEFLLRERTRAYEQKPTLDCRYASCNGCGVCDGIKTPSRLRKRAPLPKDAEEQERYTNRLVFATRDQNAHRPNWDENGKLICKEKQSRPKIDPALTTVAVQYRVWHTKEDAAAYISQLELQSILERALRRAQIPVAFSQGFHPMPLLSFGRALPVGVESTVEWFSLSLAKFLTTTEFQERLQSYLPQGLTITGLERVTNQTRSLQAQRERFALLLHAKHLERSLTCFSDFLAKTEVLHTFTTKKGPKTRDIRPLLVRFFLQSASSLPKDCTILSFETNWQEGYLSPLRLVRVILGFPEESLEPVLALTKTAQIFEQQVREKEPAILVQRNQAT